MERRLRLYWQAASTVQLGADVWQRYWSAAFISYVMQQAGTDRDFRYDPRHSYYVHWAIKNAIAKPAVHPVQAHPVLAVKPRVGDVVCNWRVSPMPYDTIAKMANPPEHPMHCDIVTEVEATRIWVVGGNKTPGSGVACPPVPKPDTNAGCTVNRTSHPLTANGLLVVPPTVPKPTTGWIAVLRIGP